MRETSAGVRDARRAHFSGILIPSSPHRPWPQTPATSLPSAVTSTARRAHLLEDSVAGAATTVTTCTSLGVNKVTPERRGGRVPTHAFWVCFTWQEGKGSGKSFVLKTSVRHFAVSHKINSDGCGKLTLTSTQVLASQIRYLTNTPD